MTGPPRGARAGVGGGRELREEIKRLEQQYERFNRHASLTFEAEGALRKQIESLEKKIETDRRALAVFRFRAPSRASRTGACGPRGAGGALPAAFAAAPGHLADARDCPSRPRALRLRSGEPPPSRNPGADRGRARSWSEAPVAHGRRAAVVTFVQRKEALEVQIGLEETLLRVDGEALENLTGYLGEREERLEELVGRRRQRGGSGRAPGAARAAERRDRPGRRRGGAAARRPRVSARAPRVCERASRSASPRIAEERRQDAESARKWLVWLESPLYPGNLARWAVERGPRVLAVLLLAGLVLLVLRFSLRRIARAVVTQSRKARSSAVNRADTLALSFQSLATTLILGRLRAPGASGGGIGRQDRPRWRRHPGCRHRLRRPEPDARLLHRLHDAPRGPVRAGRPGHASETSPGPWSG